MILQYVLINMLGTGSTGSLGQSKFLMSLFHLERAFSLYDDRDVTHQTTVIQGLPVKGNCRGNQCIH
jgi:hypothetical protein